MGNAAAPARQRNTLSPQKIFCGAFLKEKRAKTGELSDDELESAAGGGCNAGEVALSVYSALVCAVDAIVSAIDDEYKRGEDNTLLCTDLNRIM